MNSNHDRDERVRELLRNGHTPKSIQHDTEVKLAIEADTTYDEVIEFRARHLAMLLSFRMRGDGGGRELWYEDVELLTPAEQMRLPLEVRELGVCMIDPAQLIKESRLRVQLNFIDTVNRRVNGLVRAGKRVDMADVMQMLQVNVNGLMGMAKLIVERRANGTSGI